MLKNKHHFRNLLAFFSFRFKKGKILKIFLLEAILAKPEWGIKHECPNCSVRFYDLTKPSPLTCPSCGYEFATDVLHRVRKTKTTKDDSDDDAEGIEEDDIDDVEANDIVDDSDDLLLHDDEDEENVVTDTSDVSTLDEEDMFPDEDTDINTEELPEELLSDDDIDADIDLDTDEKNKPK